MQIWEKLAEFSLQPESYCNGFFLKVHPTYFETMLQKMPSLFKIKVKLVEMYGIKCLIPIGKKFKFWIKPALGTVDK